MTAERKVDLFKKVEVEEQNDEVQQREKVFARLTLMDNVELETQRWTEEGWSGTFKYYGKEKFILRERASGSIEIEYRPYNPVSGKLMKAKRKRTGETNIGKALTVAIKDFMHDEHTKRVVNQRGTPETEGDRDAPNAAADPSVEDCAILIRALGCLHHDPKQRRHEEKVLDLCSAVWGNKALSHLGNKNVEHFYKVRRAGFKWPDRFSERRSHPLSSNPKLITIQKDLETFKNLLNRLKGENHPETGEPYLIYNRLEDLKLGNYSKAQRPDAHPDRYAWVFRFADESLERLRDVGYDASFYREDKETGELTLKKQRRYLTDVVPGMTRMMLVYQYGHGMRPGSWRHIYIEDVAVDVLGVHDLIDSLRLARYDERIRSHWAPVWVYGATVYRKEYLKGNADRRYERVVPHSEPMLAELLLYLNRREEWLKQRGETSPWLFPNPSDPSKPISDGDARQMLYAAEALGREKASEMRSPEYAKVVLKDLEDTAWYAYRRAWKTLRNALGWHENKNANYCGGWSTKVGQIAETVYARLMPQFMLAVVEGLSVVEAVERYAQTDELKMSINITPDRLPGEE